MRIRSLVVSVLLLLGVATLPAQAETSTKSGFLKEVKAAIEAGNSDKMIQLTSLQDTPPKVVADLKKQMPLLLQGLGKVRKVVYEQPSGSQEPHAQEGALWGPNLKVLGVIVVYKADGSKVSLRYGKQGDQYRLASVKKVGDLPTNGTILLNYNGFGRLITAKLNGKTVTSGKASGMSSITAYVKKGKNTLTLSWKPEPNTEMNLKLLGGDATVSHTAPDGQVRFDKKVEMKGPSGQASIEFEL